MRMWIDTNGCEERLHEIARDTEGCYGVFHNDGEACEEAEFKVDDREENHPMTTIQVSVTASDIAVATEKFDDKVVEYNGACECPIAIALRRTYPQAKVHNHIVILRVGEPALLPATARNFIRAFDAGERVEPIIFELEVSDAN